MDVRVDEHFAGLGLSRTSAEERPPEDVIPKIIEMSKGIYEISPTSSALPPPSSRLFNIYIQLVRVLMDIPPSLLIILVVPPLLDIEMPVLPQ